MLPRYDISDGATGEAEPPLYKDSPFEQRDDESECCQVGISFCKDQEGGSSTQDLSSILFLA